MLLLASGVVISDLSQLVGSIECLRCICINGSQISQNSLLFWMIVPSISLQLIHHLRIQLVQSSGCHNFFLGPRHFEGINFEPELVGPVSHDLVASYRALVVDLMRCLTIGLAKSDLFTV